MITAPGSLEAGIDELQEQIMTNGHTLTEAELQTCVVQLHDVARLLAADPADHLALELSQEVRCIADRVDAYREARRLQRVGG